MRSAGSILRAVTRLVLIAVVGAFVLPGDSAAIAAGSGVIERISVASDGSDGNNTSGSYGGIPISADGRFVAFHSYSTTLTPEGSAGIFLRDREAGTTEQIVAGAHFNVGIDMSADGRYVTFASPVSDLVPDDTNTALDFFVYDRNLDVFERASVASDESEGEGDADRGWFAAIAISADGRFVAFASRAGNLVPDDTNGALDIFVRDRVLGTTNRVSVASDGTQANDLSGFLGVSVSADGRFVAFDSRATNLAPGDTNGVEDVYVRDRDADGDGIYDEPGAVETVRVSADSGGYWPAISDDGRFVAFHVCLPLGSSVVLHDRQSGDTQPVAETAQYCYEGGAATAVHLSSDGRFVAFASDFSLAPEDTNSFTDVYLYHRLTGTMELLSMAKDGSQGNANSAWGFLLERLSVIALTSDARYAAFYSGANLVLDDTKGRDDVFVVGTSVLAGPVGGIAVDPNLGALPLETAGSSGGNGGLPAGIIGGVAAAAIAFGSAAWYARRR